MPFSSNFDLALSMIDGVKMVSLHGFVGSGKTALAFAIAQHLVEKYGYRYIFSNVKSVWNDNPLDVVLSEGRYVDAVLILDEGGLFIKNHKAAEEWLAGMRKINCCILIPSVVKLPSLLQTVEIRRIANKQRLGIPSLTYQVTLDIGDKTYRQDDVLTFDWFRPSEIWGVYDTYGFPSTDDGLMGHIDKWIANITEQDGYHDTAKSRQIRSIFAGATTDEVSTVETGGGQTLDKQSVEGEKSATISILKNGKTS